MVHMLNCKKYPNNFIAVPITIPQVDNIWQWLLHSDMSYKVRMKVSQWIHSRWRLREQAIQTSPSEDPWNTGGTSDMENPYRHWKSFGHGDNVWSR